MYAKPHITNMTDVEEFFTCLVSDLHCSFHPDRDFRGYELQAQPRYTASQSKRYNRLMGETKAVCKSHGIDVYGLALHVLKANDRFAAFCLSASEPNLYIA